MSWVRLKDWNHVEMGFLRLTFTTGDVIVKSMSGRGWFRVELWTRREERLW